MSTDPLRWALALLAVCAYLVLLLRSWRHARQRAGQAGPGGSAGGQRPWWVAYASQTGTGLALAKAAAARLEAAGCPVQLVSLGALSWTDLQDASRLLLVASTCGEGQAPDNAQAFVQGVMAGRWEGPGRALAHLSYGLLALGDDRYARFCGFGRALAGWLEAQGATASFAPVWVNRGDGAALACWSAHLAGLAGLASLAEAAGNHPLDSPQAVDVFAPWRLVARAHLNPGSAGEAVYGLSLVPESGELPAWLAGDLAQIQLPQDPGVPRDYSIASIPAAGQLELLVRRRRRPDGEPGAASRLLCDELPLGGRVALRLRRNPLFHGREHLQGPAILIGAGSGLAGLLGHLSERIHHQCRETWLIFGERNRASDYLLGERLEAWLQSGWLRRLDLAFSRDGGAESYVQDCLRAQRAELFRWLEQGAALYVCGSLRGMGEGVDQTLRSLLGDPAFHALVAAGRYRRDVY